MAEAGGADVVSTGSLLDCSPRMWPDACVSLQLLLLNTFLMWLSVAKFYSLIFLVSIHFYGTSTFS